ncbi:hypothetical protein ACEPAF_5973 [Sanghuangporus sanghuang]
MSFGVPRRIEVKYDAQTIQNMLTLLKAAPLPDKAPVDAAGPWKLGMDIDYLKKLKTMFLTEWKWDSLGKKIAKFDNFLVHYEHEEDTFDLHYLHVKSQRRDAIPLILCHGWPGTFFDFHKVIEPLVNPASPDLPAFHIVVPSIPGFFLSTLPRRFDWDLIDIAKIYHGLMASVLGYEKYAGQGGDWGCAILRLMGCLLPESVLAMHYNMFRQAPEPGSDPSTYSEIEKRVVARGVELNSTGSGYFEIQRTKPFTIGCAIASSPLAMLAYIGEKIHDWSDPDRINPWDILDTVALYYLSGSFATSVMIYNQAQKLRAELMSSREENKWILKTNFGLSAFPFEIGGASRHDTAKFGPLVYYKEHSGGGHFPALDSPSEFVDDLQDFFGEHWPRA